MENQKPSFEEVNQNQESPNDAEKERQERVGKILRLVEKINESGENLPFPGVNPEAYSRMKKDEDEFPGYTTPIDEIIERCKKEGIKIITGKNPESGNIFVLPALSDNIEMDSIAPHQLEISAVKDEHLIELIQLTTKKR